MRQPSRGLTQSPPWRPPTLPRTPEPPPRLLPYKFLLFLFSFPRSPTFLLFYSLTNFICSTFLPFSFPPPQKFLSSHCLPNFSSFFISLLPSTSEVPPLSLTPKFLLFLFPLPSSFHLQTSPLSLPSRVVVFLCCFPRPQNFLLFY